MDVLKAAVAALVCLGTGCVDLGKDGTWTPIEAMSGALAPTVGTLAIGTPTVAPHGTLRVVTYNIRDGGIDPLAIAAAFRANPALADADVVMIQEAEAFPEEESIRIQRLATALDMGWIYAPARAQNTGTLGDAIMSRYPLDNFAVMQLAIAPRKRQRIAVAADVHVGGLTLRLVTTHLDTTINITNRILQLRPAVIDLPDMALVAGDFNTNPYAWEDGAIPLLPTSKVVDTDQAPILDDYMAGIGFVNPTAALGATEVRYGIESRLDAVFARGVEVVGGGVERSVTVSDHWPVWIDVKMQP